MFALRTFGATARQQSKRFIQKDPAQMMQKRGMAGGEDDGVHRVNWWDAPQNPDVWKKHQLAWWTTGFYCTVYWLVAGGSKKEEAAK